MKDWGTKVDNDPTQNGYVNASEYNSLFGEIKSMIIASGQSLDKNSVVQLLNAIKYFCFGDNGGVLTKVVAGGTSTLTDTEASSTVMSFTGALTSNAVVVVPTTGRKFWIVRNTTSGAFTLSVKTASGSAALVLQGKTNVLYTDGVSVFDAMTDFDSVSLTGVPTAPTAATGNRSLQIATTAFVGAECAIAAPVGSVYAFAGATVPSGWLKCNGGLLSRVTYAALFAVVGTTYGAGDGSSTFAIPDFRGRFLRGLDDGVGLDTGRTLGVYQEGTWLRTMAQEWSGSDVGTGTLSIGNAYAQPDATIRSGGVGGAVPSGAMSPGGSGYSNATTDNVIQGSVFVDTAQVNNWIRMRPCNSPVIYIVKF